LDRPADLSAFRSKFLYSAIMIRDAALSLVHGRHVTVVEKVSLQLLTSTRRLIFSLSLQLLASFDADEFKALGNMMNDVVSSLQHFKVRLRAELSLRQIDWEESSNVGRVTVKSGIDHELDELRRAYAGLPSLLVSLLRARHFSQLWS